MSSDLTQPGVHMQMNILSSFAGFFSWTSLKLFVVTVLLWSVYLVSSMQTWSLLNRASLSLTTNYWSLQCSEIRWQSLTRIMWPPLSLFSLLWDLTDNCPCSSLYFWPSGSDVLTFAETQLKALELINLPEERAGCKCWADVWTRAESAGLWNCWVFALPCVRALAASPPVVPRQSEHLPSSHCWTWLNSYKNTAVLRGQLMKREQSRSNLSDLQTHLSNAKMLHVCLRAPLTGKSCMMMEGELNI